MSIDELLQAKTSCWMDGSDRNSDVVISSRVRLARNLEGFPFPLALSETRSQEVAQKIKEAIDKAGTKSGDYEFVAMQDITPLERFVLVERHLISPQHVENPVGKGVAIRDDQAVSIMVNEEDHLRIQCLLPGLNLEKAWNTASNADDLLEGELDLAYDEKLGYLTCCPTNTGTGMRASAMVHLPALVMTNQVSKVLGLLPQLGLAVRGLYGEGSQALGNLFQISNQITLGQTETDIITNLSAVTKQIVDKEQETRQVLLREAKEQLEDRVCRAYGTLANARLMPGQEALSLLSDLCLGIDLGIIPRLPANVFTELIVTTSPAHLQYLSGREMSAAIRDIERAKIIRSRMEAQAVD
ncbi:MAG TPA: protein arginine kinase [Desulfobacteria bacterium]|nr:protein arginine kinase [Desulfobacteria bacterium]